MGNKLREYIIGTGYYTPPEKYREEERIKFFNIWWNNTIKYSNPKTVYILNSNSVYPDKNKGEWLNLPVNPGHTTNPNRESIYCGGIMAMVVPALMAYASGCDFIHKEQDCLCFGDWISQLRKDCNEQNKQMLIARFKNDQNLQVEISLFYIKWEYIPKFLSYITSLLYKNQDKNYPAEWRFRDLLRMFPEDIGFLSFGYGRDRPVNLEDEIFFIQHVGYDRSEKAQKLFDELKEKGFIIE